MRTSIEVCVLRWTEGCPVLQGPHNLPTKPVSLMTTGPIRSTMRRQRWKQNNAERNRHYGIQCGCMFLSALTSGLAWVKEAAREERQPASERKGTPLGSRPHPMNHQGREPPTPSPRSPEPDTHPAARSKTAPPRMMDCSRNCAGVKRADGRQTSTAGCQGHKKQNRAHKGEGDQQADACRGTPAPKRTRKRRTPRNPNNT